MKPRYQETSSEVKKMLQKAEILAKRADEIEKGMHHLATSFSTEPSGEEFHIVQGETSRNMFYTSNQSLLDSTDVANKGAKNSSVNMDALSKKLNTHDTNVKEDSAGGKEHSGQSLE